MSKTCYLKNVICFLALAVLVITAGCNKPVDVEPKNPLPIDTIPQKQKTWTVSTVAGTGQLGYMDGPATVAQFNFPSYLAIDTAGNLLVSDLQNYRIRKISNGQVTTFAGKGISNPDPAFGAIYGLAVDKQNNFYDVEYALIRRFTSGTSSTVFAGSLEELYKDGHDTAARFHVINRIIADKDGNLYVPDYDMDANFLIRKITPSGIVSTIPLQDNTGFPSGSSANHFYLSPIAIDNSRNMYFTANGNQLIKKADSQGNVTVFAGAGNIGFTDGKGSEAQFYDISALTIDASGNVYVIDAGNHAVRKVTPDGTVSTIAGRAGPGFKDGDATTAMLSYPFDITIDKKGLLYVADAGNHRIRKLEYK